MKERFPRGIIVSAVLLSVLAMQICTFAATWVGGQSDDWNESANWSPAAVPGLDDGVGIGTSKTNYWPVIYDDSGSAIDAWCGLLCMTETSGYSQLTFDGGVLGMSTNAYAIVGRHTGDTALLTVKSGGIGLNQAGTIYYPARWLRIGEADSVANGGGKGAVIMNGGKVYAQAVTVGNRDGLGDAGSSLTVNDGAELYAGLDYFEASFDIGPTASMTINPGGFVKLYAQILRGDPMTSENARVWAKGALNLVADASGTARMVIPAVVDSVAQLEAYFGYRDGGTLVPGNINAIYNGGAGQFVFSYPGGIFTEVTVIPEPTTIALLSLGGLALIRRKL